MSMARGYELLVGAVILVTYTAVSVAGVAILAWVFADPPGLLALALAFGIGVVVAGFAGYRFGTVRLIASLNAREIAPERAPELFRRFDRLCTTMGLTRPPVLVANLNGPNALTIGGPRQGAVIIDWSLLELLTIDELEAILAHELAHMIRRDTFVNTLALTAMRSVAGFVFILLLPIAIFLAGLDRALGWFSGHPGSKRGFVLLFHWVVTLTLGLLLGFFTLSYLAYSRRQEYAADQQAVRATGKPAALARALAKIHRANEPRLGLISLLYTHDRRNERRSLLSTHPPVEKRIERLLRDAELGNHHYINRLRPH